MAVSIGLCMSAVIGVCEKTSQWKAALTAAVDAAVETLAQRVQLHIMASARAEKRGPVGGCFVLAQRDDFTISVDALVNYIYPVIEEMLSAHSAMHSIVELRADGQD
jgi:hypothetical protein